MNAPFYFFLSEYVDAVRKDRVPELMAQKHESHPYTCAQLRLLVCLAYHVKRPVPWFLPRAAESADYAYFGASFDRSRWAPLIRARLRAFQDGCPEKETNKILRVLEAFMLMAAYGEPAEWPVRESVRAYICEAPMAGVIDFCIDAAVDWLANPNNAQDP